MTDAAAQAVMIHPQVSSRLKTGICWGMGAAAIWSGWWVMTRLSVTTGLAGPDLAALRFGVAGIALLPVLWRGRRELAGVPLHLLLVMTAGAGAPYALVAATALRFASAGNGGALTLGLLPMFTAILSVWVLNERVGRIRAVGIGVIAAGAVAIAAQGFDMSGAWRGHLLFMLGAAMWSGYTVAMRRSGLSAMTATSVVCVLSAAAYLPVYLMAVGPHGLLAAPMQQVVVQALYQGVLSAVGALFCYSQAVTCLGATRASVFTALVPALATVLGVGLLGELPSGVEGAGVALLSLGAYVASRSSTAGSSAPAGQIPRTAARFPTQYQPVISTLGVHLRHSAAKGGA